MAFCLIQAMPSMVLAGDVRVGFPLLEPFASADADKKIWGIYPDLMQVLKDKTDHGITQRATPLQRMWKEFEQGKIDAMFSFPTPRHDHLGKRAAFIFKMRVIAASRSDSSICTLKDLENKLVGTLFNISYLPEVVKPQYHDTSRDYEQLARKFAGGRLAVALGVELPMIYQIRRQGLTQHDLRPAMIIREAPLYFYTRRGSGKGQHLSEIATGLTGLSDSGRIERIIRRYIPDLPDLSNAPKARNTCPTA